MQGTGEVDLQSLPPDMRRALIRWAEVLEKYLAERDRQQQGNEEGPDLRQDPNGPNV
jgi:hypothetical protein